MILLFNKKNKGLQNIMMFKIVILIALMLCTVHELKAEYGDIIINNYSDEAGMNPAVFPHWFHRIRFRCKVCHADLGFKFKAGGNEINMLKIIDGQYCGACHNGEVAWSIENCNLCHTGKSGTPTQVHGSTLNMLIKPRHKKSTKIKAVKPGKAKK